MKTKGLLFILFALPNALAHADIIKSNSVYTITLLEDYYPMITRVEVDSHDFVPHDNAGADLQMAIRSSAGNSYNPTLGGDCLGNASTLWGLIENWGDAGLGISSSNGIALGVIPRFYNENASGVCQGAGYESPFNMTWGVTLGDGVILPSEVMMLDMSFARENAGSGILLNISEFPAMFADRDLFEYMYYSHDGINWNPWLVEGSHDVGGWVTGVNHYKNIKAVWVSNQNDALNNPDTGNGIGIYANGTTTFVTGKRVGQLENLVYMAALGDDNTAATYNDDYWHGWRRLVVVGNLTTVTSAISSTVNQLGGTEDWVWTDTTTPRFSEY